MNLPMTNVQYTWQSAPSVESIHFLGVRAALSDGGARGFRAGALALDVGTLAAHFHIDGARPALRARKLQLRLDIGSDVRVSSAVPESAGISTRFRESGTIFQGIFNHPVPRS